MEDKISIVSSISRLINKFINPKKTPTHQQTDAHTHRHTYTHSPITLPPSLSPAPTKIPNGTCLPKILCIISFDAGSAHPKKYKNAEMKGIRNSNGSATPVDFKDIS